MIPILPVALRNIIEGYEFVLISTQGGANFYIGNCKDADGITVVALGPQLRGGGNIMTISGRHPLMRRNVAPGAK